MWLFQFKPMKNKQKVKISVSIIPVTLQVLNSPMKLVATELDSAKVDHHWSREHWGRKISRAFWRQVSCSIHPINHSGVAIGTSGAPYFHISFKVSQMFTSMITSAWWHLGVVGKGLPFPANRGWNWGPACLGLQWVGGSGRGRLYPQVLWFLGRAWPDGNSMSWKYRVPGQGIPLGTLSLWVVNVTSGILIRSYV